MILLKQLWDKLKVLNSGARLLFPRVFLLNCRRGWSLANPALPPQIRPTPDGNAGARVSGTLARCFGGMSLLWLLLVAGLRTQYLEECSGKGDRSLWLGLLRCAAERWILG